MKKKTSKLLRPAIRITEAFDLPAQIISGKIVITGRSQVFLENHRGLLEYTQERIQVSNADSIIEVRGSNLKLKSMNISELSITGSIFAVEFKYIQENSDHK